MISQRTVFCMNLYGEVGICSIFLIFLLNVWGEDLLDEANAAVLFRTFEFHRRNGAIVRNPMQSSGRLNRLPLRTVHAYSTVLPVSCWFLSCFVVCNFWDGIKTVQLATSL